MFNRDWKGTDDSALGGTADSDEPGRVWKGYKDRLRCTEGQMCAG